MKRKITSCNFILGAVITVFMLALILLGFVWTPYDPEAMQGSLKLQPPSLLHIFGTDQFGRDILSRVLSGAGSTLLIALGTILMGGIAGILVGAFTGCWPLGSHLSPASQGSSGENFYGCGRRIM